MNIEDQIMLTALYFVLLSVAGIRLIYLFWMSWKWDQMIMHYVQYKSLHWSQERLKTLLEDCNKIRWKRWSWVDLSYWGPAEGLFESKSNPKLWFEIVDHWYN